MSFEVKYKFLQKQAPQREIHVGIVGAGIGGLAAAIALRRAGAKVTILEAAKQLGEVSLPQCDDFI
jgi:2-polyprenyl-6-methoxyphenol hydroxylase-like FAD-dependent oxidoreductase